MSAVARAASKPRLRPDVVLGPALRAGDTAVHHVKDRRTGWFYKVGPREHFIMSRLDGAHTLDEIASEYDQEFARTLGPGHWAQIFTMLGRRQLLDGDGAAGADEAALARLAEAHRATRAADRSLLRRRFAVTFPASWCAAAAARLRFAWRLWFAVPVVLAALAVEGYALGHLGGLAAAAGVGAHPWQIVPADVAGVWLLILAHELGHGLTCAHYGGTVTEIGIMWRFPMLVPYCKTDDMTLFGARGARVATAFAGMFTGLAALPALWAWWALSGPVSASHSVAAGLLLFTAITTLTNLTPFLGLDGYHMLTHALGYADLRADSRRYWFGLLSRRVPADRSLSRADRLVHVAYGVATAAFFGGGYAVLSTLWFHRLERWMPPAAAGVVLGAETLLILALFAARRPRPRAGESPRDSPGDSPRSPRGVRGNRNRRIMSDDDVIIAAGLSKRYPGGVVGVEGLNLRVRRGEVFGLLGPNGAGKTTTLRMLVGLIRPTSGTLTVAGHPAGAQPGLARVGALIESPAFYPHLSGRDNLRLLARYAGIGDDRVEQVLAEVDMGERAGRDYRTYSLGMKQRIGVAAALLKDPELLILDEPTNGLDPAGMAAMRDLVKSLRHERRAVVLSSHLLVEVEHLCDRVAVIRSGRKVAEGTLAELRDAASGSRGIVVRATPAEGAEALLRARSDVRTVERDGDALRVDADAGAAGPINTDLVRAGFEVSELRAYERSLEDIFFQLTGDENGDENRGGSGGDGSGGGSARAAAASDADGGKEVAAR